MVSQAHGDGRFSCQQLYSARLLPYIASMKKTLLLFLSLALTACGSTPTRHHHASDDQMNELVMYAVSLADTPYRYGGNSANSGFDCSGFVGHVYRHSLGISLPRTSHADQSCRKIHQPA